MIRRSRMGRTVIATLLCACVATTVASPIALAQNRGNSGLPSGPGNPTTQLADQMAALQQQINALSAQVGSLSAQASSTATAGLLGVYDANGQRIGDVLGVDGNVPWIGLPVRDRIVALQVYPQQMIGMFVWYENLDCTGKTYIAGSALTPANVFVFGAVAEPHGVVYVQTATGTVGSKLVGSVLGTDGVCASLGKQALRTAVEAEAALDLDALFQRPYAVR
jgi:hypothetical protein